jgi:chromosome segregation ATPase
MESAAIDIAREKVEETKQEKSIEAKEMEDKEAFLDDELLKLESEVGKLRIEEEALGREAQLRSGEYKKARLKMQRFDIETRNLRQLIMNQAKGGDGADSPGRIESLEAQVRDIESQKKLFEPELASLQAAAEEVDRKLALVRTTMAEIMGKMTLSRKRKSIVVSSLQKQVETIEGKFRGMQDQQNDAIRRLALACVERGDLPAEFKGMKEKLAGKRKALAAAADKLARTKAARDSYSRSAFQRAYITVGGGVALLVLLIILLGLIF